MQLDLITLVISPIVLLDQSLQVAGLDLLVGQNLFERWKPEDHTQHAGHSPMAGQGLIVKDQVLKIAPLYGHHHDLMGAVQRCDHPGCAVLKADPILVAGPGTYSAAQAEILVETGQF